MIAAHEQCSVLIETEGRVPMSALSAETMQDADEIDALIEDGGVGLAEDFDLVALCKDLRQDVTTLRELLVKIAHLGSQDDPKLVKLLDILRKAAANPNPDKRKTLVFTSFVDTVRYIKDFLEDIASKEPVLADMIRRSAYVLGNQETELTRGRRWL